LLSADFLAIARAAGRVLRLQGSPFQAKCFFGSPTRGCFQKKAFHYSSKTRSARATCNCAAPKHETGAAGRVLRLQGSPFQAKCFSFESPLQGVMHSDARNAFFAFSKQNQCRASCNCKAWVACGRAVRPFRNEKMLTAPRSTALSKG